FAGEVFEPTDQIALSCVCGESAQRMKLRVDRQALVHDAYLLLAIDQSAANRSPGLKARENDVTVLAPEVVLEMMDDATAVTHAGSGNDDRTTGDLVDGDGFVRCLGTFQ